MPLVQCLHGTTLLCTPVLKSAPAYKPVNSLAESVRADDLICFNACVQSSIRAYTRAFVRTLGVNAAAGRYNPSNASPYYNEHHKVRAERVEFSRFLFSHRLTAVFDCILRRVLYGPREGADTTGHARNPVLVQGRSPLNVFRRRLTLSVPLPACIG